jgi:type IV pilus assembly protein PilC
MVKAGLPILNVLGMLRDQLEHPELKIIVEEIRKNLEGGLTLSNVLKNTLIFSIIFISILLKLVKPVEN